jgi:hypothetical protein
VCNEYELKKYPNYRGNYNLTTKKLHRQKSWQTKTEQALAVINTHCDILLNALCKHTYNNFCRNTWIILVRKLNGRSHMLDLGINIITIGQLKKLELQGEKSGFVSRQVQEIFLVFTGFRPPLGSTQPPIRCVRGTVSRGVKRPGSEANHSPPSSTEFKSTLGDASSQVYNMIKWPWAPT